MAARALAAFLLAGLALFGVFRALNPASAQPEPVYQIRLTEDDIRQTAMAWLAQGRSPPSPQQMDNLMQLKIREEIFYREALALGLDKDDTIVKRRLAQKMEFLAEDLASIAEPHPDELRAWFERNAERFALAPRASFRHLYFSPDHRAARAREDAARLLEKLRGLPAGTPMIRRRPKLSDRAPCHRVMKAKVAM